jgi:hypothetical protein
VRAQALRAHRLTTGPAWLIASEIPVLGRPIETARGLALASDQLANQALEPVARLADAVSPSQLRQGGNRINIGRLASAEPGLRAAHTALTTIGAQVAALPGNTWLGSVDDARSKVCHATAGRMNSRLS